ncbi:maltase A2-like protein [Dinothrombium tinctorium]|uniref:Maltase A2-like protein n=1 Tax=Dinothrombium tinctorium TaxID=1965070 RepID=A0A3S3QS36_9ACAR|nr:maltase A2-like protein [Dinothrombium tinctorium]RWS14612.1 maltase A2-like protein [Dinothrombium tinctorium]
MNRNKAELFVDTDLNYVPFIETPDAYGANKADINYFENEDTQTCLVAYVDESGGIYNPHVNCTSSKSSSTESDVYSCTRLLDNNCSDNHVAVTDATTNATIAEMALKLGHSLSQDYDARMALNNADCDYDVWTKIQNSMTNSLRRNYLKKTQCEKKRGFISRCLRGITNNKLSQLLLLTIVVCAFVILVIAVLTVKSYHFSRIVKSDANDDASDQYTNNNREEEWWKSGIFYEIFTASFKDTNSDGFGDIDGIKQKLPYLKELGVNVLRLNSIFSALDYPYQYEHVIDFVNVDPHIGTLNSFKSLVREIHKQGMYIVLDINPTVTSDQHPWAAHWLLNSTGKYRYFFVDNKHITAESTSSTAVDRKTSEMEETHLSFGGHLYLNWSHASVVRNMLECMRFWVRTGIDGFFLRNLEQIKIDDQFPEALFQILDNIRDVLNDQIANNVASEKSYRSGRKRILIASRRSLQSLSQRIQMQLTTKYFTTNKNKSKNVARNGSQLFEDHSSENDHYNNKDVFSHFDLVDTLLEINLNKTENIREQVNSVFLNNHNSDFWVLWSVGTSTTSRLASRIGSDYIAAAAFLLTMLPGSINILYGDEIGLKDSVDPVTNKVLLLLL